MHHSPISRPKLTGLTAFLCLLLLPVAGLHAQVISTIAGAGGIGFSGDGGPALGALFSNPISVTPGQPNTIFISDFDNFRIRKVNLLTNVITTIAGSGTAGFTGDGGPAINARMRNPGDLVADEYGNVYFCDGNNFRVRRIDAVTGQIRTVLGGGGIPYGGGSAVAVNAGISYPNALAMGKNGEYLFVALWPSSYIVRLDLSTGIMTQVAGNGGNDDLGDGGPAIAASFRMPMGLAVDPDDNLYIADAQAHRVRRVGTNGNITTVAGTGTVGYTGDGAAAAVAALSGPTGVGIDPAGNLFIADRGNNLVRKVDMLTGLISVAAGSGGYGFAGDGLQANSPCVQLADPHKVRFDDAGNYFISDQSNGRIRMVRPGAAPPTSAPSISIISDNSAVCSNTPVNFTATAINTSGTTSYQWKVDNVNVGSNGNSFSISTLTDGQVVSCVLTTGSGCGPDLAVTSNELSIDITPQVTASVTVEASDLVICAGETASFTATALNGGSNPLYQWSVDGVNAGTNSPTLVLTNVGNFTRVTCTLTSNAGCLTSSDPVISSEVVIAATAPFDPSVSIEAQFGPFCSGSMAYFGALSNATQLSPVYEWTVNGVPAGTNNQGFSSNSLHDGDLIRCRIILDPSVTCLLNTTALSNEIVAQINENPPVSLVVTANDNELCQGETAALTAVAANAGTGASFQWIVNGNDVSGATSPVFSGTVRNNDRVSCRLTPGADACPSAVIVSDPVNFLVSAPPVITVASPEIYISAGNSAQLPVTLSNDVTDFEWSPAGLLQSATTASPVTLPLSTDQVFSITASNAAGCSTTAYLTVKIYTDLFIPTAFTPNNDGINDVFRIPPGVNMELDEFAVFNRWGQKVFATKNTGTGWDGTRLGEALPAGVYVYQLSGRQSQKKVYVKGTVTLVR
ncbi:MAG: T9SS type B sorting domain-containing protein [Chitinophagaceae bacterium]|nr:MAG: T9SS type B sorting domain-containing protein [Chitinophagaceae bacterium]